MPGTILIIEDDAAVRDFLDLVLSDHGYVVRSVVHGRQALQLLAQWRPQLIVLDLVTPVMDGWEFRRRQLDDADLARIPTLIFSTVPDLQRVATALGATAFLQRPFDLEVLLARVAELLGEQGSQQAD